MTILSRKIERGALLWASIAIALAFAQQASAAGAAGTAPILPDYWEESAFLTDVPGASSSLAAGLFNPAAWPVRPMGGLYFAWDELMDCDERGAPDRSDWIGIASLRALSFGVRSFRFDYGDDELKHQEEYTIGLGGGSDAGGFGASYSWSDGSGGAPRAKRLGLGGIGRWEPLSFGLAGMISLEDTDDVQRDPANYALQADLGLRPFGPRLTLFADAGWREHDDWDDIRTGYGLEAHPYRGIVVGAKALNTGEVSVRLGVGLSPGLHPAASMRFDDIDNDAEHLATTYMIETTAPRPDLGFSSPRAAYPEVDLKGPIVYRRYMLFDERRTLLGTLRQFDQYATDPAVKGVVVNLSGIDADIEMIWEVRTQLAGLRDHGKRVVIYFDEGGMGSYLLASVADQVWMDPVGMLDIRGVLGGRTYLRGTLDKLGIGFEEWRFFTYKSAYETFSRRSLSAADSIQISALITDYYDDIADAVTASRGITRADWDNLINEKGVLLPKEAQTAGLVDSVGSFDDAKKAIKHAAPGARPAGEATVLGDLVGNPVWGPLEWGQRPRIAVLYAIGPTEMDSGIEARKLSRQIVKARDDRSVKAIVLRADSPGGSGLASDLVAREMLATSKKKPVIVSQGAVAGSGGYWISMYGDTIISSPYTLTGSVGVIGGWFWDAGFGQKLGVTWDAVWRGRHADLGHGIQLPLLGLQVPQRPLTSDENALVELLIRTQYDEFVTKVAAGRHMSKTGVDSIGQGRIWSGTDARQIGLVDEIGGLWQGLRVAKEAAHIRRSREVEITEGPGIGLLDFGFLRPRFFGLLGGARTPAEVSVDPWESGGYPSVVAPGAVISEGERAYLETLLRAHGGPIFMMEPFRLQFAGD